MTTLVLPRVALALAAVRAIQWPIRRLGPYSCVLGFLLVGVATLGLSRAVLIGWQWDRVDPTDALFSMMLQGLRSDLITLGLFAAPMIVLLPLFLAFRRVKWWLYLCTAWLSFSLILIALLEFATPQFIYEYDSRPNRLFIEYLVYPREVFAMLWSGYRASLALVAIGLGAATWLVIRHFRQYNGHDHGWRKRTVLMVWPIVVVALFVMIRSSFQHRPANL